MQSAEAEQPRVLPLSFLEMLTEAIEKGGMVAGELALKTELLSASAGGGSALPLSLRAPSALEVAARAIEARAASLATVDLGGTSLIASVALPVLAQALARAPHLRTLSLRGAELARAEELAPLTALRALRELDVSETLLSRADGWRSRVMRLLPSLELLNGELAAFSAEVEEAATANRPGPLLERAELQLSAGPLAREPCLPPASEFLEAVARRTAEIDAEYERAVASLRREIASVHEYCSSRVDGRKPVDVSSSVEGSTVEGSEGRVVGSSGGDSNGSSQVITSTDVQP